MPLPKPEMFALAQRICESSPVIAVFAAPEWDCLHDDDKTWVAAIVEQAALGTVEEDGVPALFASGFGAAWAVVAAQWGVIPFQLSDAEIQKAWAIHVDQAGDRK